MSSRLSRTKNPANPDVSKQFSKILIFIIISTPIFYLGCATLAGVAIGTAIDRSKPEHTNIALGAIKNLKQSTKIYLISEDSSVTAGEYFGFAGLLISDFQEDSSLILPSYNEPIRIIDKYGRSRRSKFGGFYFQLDSGNYNPKIRLEEADRRERFSLSLYSCIVNSSGDTIQSIDILRDFGGSGLPSGSVILLAKSENVRLIPVERIVRVEVDTPKSAENWVRTGVIIDVVSYLFIRFVIVRSIPND